MKNTGRIRNITLATFLVVVSFLLCAMLFAPISNTASAKVVESPYDESLDWEQLYKDYIGETDKDWYLQEEYLDFYNALEEVKDILGDKSFNKEALKADPIIVAVIDDGIGNIYVENADGSKTAQGATAFFTKPNNLELKYEIHPIFKDVLLTDENGDFVYKNTVEVYTVVNKDYTVVQNGNIAHDMFSFTNHGTATAGTIAFFIHKFGLEDYIKIVPIKADNYLTASGVSYTNAQYVQNAINFANEVGADVLSLSLSAMSKDYFTDEMRQKTLIVQSAGNEAQYVASRYPAQYDDVLGVTNYDRNADGSLVLYEKVKADGTVAGSNYGEIFDISAPGEFLVVPTRLGTYGYVGGTSMSVPVVSFAGALAMVRYKGFANHNSQTLPTIKAYKEMIPYCASDVVTKVAPEGTFEYPTLNFNNLVTYDFWSDDEFLKKANVETYFSTNAKAEMLAGDIVSSYINTTNEAYANATPKWTCQVNGVTYQTGNGWSFDLEVPEVAGNYVITCEIVDSQGKAIYTATPVKFMVKEWGRDWQEIYDDYTANIFDDWYFDEQYLDLYNAIIEASKMVNDSAFNKEALKNDPIVIALIDTGISAVYDATGVYDGARCGITQTFINPIEVEYRLHPIFEDVLLTDKNGNYVYYVSAENFTYESTNGTITTIDWFNTGNIAQDMISFNDHGVGVTGIVAYLIHQFGLEDYIKIMPIKADDRYFRTNGVLQLAYSEGTIDNAVQWAYDHGADIVNASFSTSATSKCMSLAKDILVVGAAGNNNSNTINYPSGHEDVLGVMNYVKDEDGNLVIYARDASESYGSTYGEWYEIAAPGETLVIPCYGLFADNYCSYKIMGGTSSSAPVVSFASALAMMRYRGYDNYGVDIELTSQVYKEMIPHCSDQVATRVDDNGIVHKFPALDLKNVLAYDFYGDIAFLEKIGVDVDNMLSVSSNAQEINMSSDIVSFTATTNIGGLFEDNNIGWWYELDGVTYEIGYGWNIDFQLPGKAGAYSVYCAIFDSDGNIIAQCGEPSKFDVYLKPESLDISGNIQDEYKVDTTASATLTATIGREEYSADTPHWWIVRDGIHTSDLGTGWSIVFDLPNVVGDYEIFCGLKDADDTVYAQCQNALEFSVTYYAVESISINGNIEKEYKVDNTASAELSVSVNPTNAHVDGEFIWICESNGVKTEIGRGANIELDVPNEVGTYKVYCTYNDIQSTNTLEFAVTYYAVESISINGNIEKEYKVDNNASVELAVSVNPTNAHVDSEFVWICESNGTKTEIGRGANIELDVPNEVGTYKVYCTYGEMVSTNSYEFDVTYYAVESISINGNIDNEYKVDNTESVELSVAVNPSNAYIDGTFVWICESNGVKTEIGRGANIELDVPNEVGTYKVYCTYGEMVSTNTLEFAVTYYAVESISINGNIEKEYKVDNTASAELSVSVNPTNAHIDGTFIWICESNGVKTEIGRGATIELDIPNKVGTYKVYCNYGNIQSTNPIEFAVEYYDHADVKWDVQATTPSSTIEKLTVGDVVNITIQGIQLYDPAIVNEIEWRVNNVNVAKGAEFSWPIYASGQYKIYAKVAGTEYLIAEFVVVAETQSTPVAPDPDPNPEPESPVIDDNGDNAMTTVIAVLSVVAVAGVGASIAIAVMARKKSKKSK